MTQRPDKPPPRPTMTEDNKNHIDDLLDEALEETFPTRDPPALLEPGPTHRSRSRIEKQSTLGTRRAAHEPLRFHFLGTVTMIGAGFVAISAVKTADDYFPPRK